MRSLELGEELLTLDKKPCGIARLRMCVGLRNLNAGRSGKVAWKGIQVASRDGPPNLPECPSVPPVAPDPQLLKGTSSTSSWPLRDSTDLVKCQSRMETQTPRPLGRDSCNLRSWPVSDVGACLFVCGLFP